MVCKTKPAEILPLSGKKRSGNNRSQQFESPKTNMTDFWEPLSSVNFSCEGRICRIHLIASKYDEYRLLGIVAKPRVAKRARWQSVSIIHDRRLSRIFVYYYFKCFQRKYTNPTTQIMRIPTVENKRRHNMSERVEETKENTPGRHKSIKFSILSDDGAFYVLFFFFIYYYFQFWRPRQKRQRRRFLFFFFFFFTDFILTLFHYLFHDHFASLPAAFEAQSNHEFPEAVAAALNQFSRPSLFSLSLSLSPPFLSSAAAAAIMRRERRPTCSARSVQCA